MATQETDSDWILDSLIGFLKGPLWGSTIQTFIDEKSVIFNPDKDLEEDEDTTEVQETEEDIHPHRRAYLRSDGVLSRRDEKTEHECEAVYDEYKRLVDTMLAAHMEEMGITGEQFTATCQREQRGGQSSISESFGVQAGNLFDQIWAAGNCTIFRRMMIERNLDLQLQTLELWASKYGTVPDLFLPQKEQHQHHKQQQQKRPAMAGNFRHQNTMVMSVDYGAAGGGDGSLEDDRHIEPALINEPLGMEFVHGDLTDKNDYANESYEPGGERNEIDHATRLALQRSLLDQRSTHKGPHKLPIAESIDQSSLADQKMRLLRQIQKNKDLMNEAIRRSALTLNEADGVTENTSINTSDPRDGTDGPEAKIRSSDSERIQQNNGIDEIVISQTSSAMEQMRLDFTDKVHIQTEETEERPERQDLTAGPTRQDRPDRRDLLKREEKVSQQEIHNRAAYLQAQRDKLVAAKKTEREKALRDMIHADRSAATAAGPLNGSISSGREVVSRPKTASKLKMTRRRRSNVNDEAPLVDHSSSEDGSMKGGGDPNQLTPADQYRRALAARLKAELVNNNEGGSDFN